MKKSAIIFWIISAVFLVCSFPLFFNDIASGIIGVLISAVLAYIGWRRYTERSLANQGKGARKSRTVYYTLDGKCYHYKRNCLRSVSVLSCREDQVKSLDLYPCPKCSK